MTRYFPTDLQLEKRMTSRDFKDSPIDRALREREEKLRQKAESDAICETMREFFTPEMWDKFVDAGPDDNAGWLAYVQAERQNILKTF